MLPQHSMVDPFRDHDVHEPESVTIPSSILQRLEQDAGVLTMIGSFLDCSGYLVNSLLDEAVLDPEASETTRQLVCALSGLEKSQGKAARHVLSAAIILDAKLKLIRQNAVLSVSSLPDMLAKEAYHLPLEPASSGLFGAALSDILERSDKLMVEKRQQALHEAAVCSVKTGKNPGQHKPKQATHGSRPKKDQQKKRKQPAKKGGQPFKQGTPATKSGRKLDARS